VAGVYPQQICVVRGRTDIDRLMPPVSRFGGGNRAGKKQRIIDRFKDFFDKYFGLGTAGITGL
jgi:type I restriction enzyme R subunit